LDLILTDMRMPGVSGFEVLVAARACAPGVPSILYSAFPTDEAETVSRALGAAEFIGGPIWADILLTAVERHLRRRTDGPAPVPLPLGHATKRWLELMEPVVREKHDVPTTEKWGKRLGMSLTAIKMRCKRVDVRPGDSLDLARGLRVTWQHEGQPITSSLWYEHFDVLESKTLDRLLDRGALTSEARIPSADSFLREQRFVAKPDLIVALRRLLGIAV
jgi:DNA-binding response OmpR family regulator